VNTKDIPANKVVKHMLNGIEDVDELHSSLIMDFRIFAPLMDDHVTAPHAIDVT
jgi:hypothetical protein